jgi:hypothetical protein
MEHEGAARQIIWSRISPALPMIVIVGGGRQVGFGSERGEGRQRRKYLSGGRTGLITSSTNRHNFTVCLKEMLLSLSPDY